MDRNGPVEAFSRGFDTTLQKSPAPRRINILQLAGYHAGLPPKPWSPNYCTASAALSSPFSLPRQPSFRLVKGTNFVTIPLPLPSFPFERRKRNEFAGRLSSGREEEEGGGGGGQRGGGRPVVIMCIYREEANAQSLHRVCIKQGGRERVLAR